MTRRAASTARLAAIGNGLLIGGFVLISALLLLWHAGAIQWRDPGPERWVDAVLVLAAWAVLVGWLRYRNTAGTRKSLLRASAPTPDIIVLPRNEENGAAGIAIRVIHASQTGFAEQLARQTLESLQLAGVPVRMDGIDTISLDDLRRAERVLFVVSTTGEGDPPDMAQAFHRRVMTQPADLSGLRYGLLALGDRDYDEFCGFGRELEHWLQGSGARSLFDSVEVDGGDEASLRHWQHHLAMQADVHDLPDWQPPKYTRWRLVARRVLNPGSAGAPCFHIELQSLQGEAVWRAGDLVEIGPRLGLDRVADWLSGQGLDGRVPVAFGQEAPQPLGVLLSRCRLPAADEVEGLDEEAVATLLQPLPHREYSIASLPHDGAIHLLVRQTRDADGELGLGSGWLTVHANVGADIALRVRSNPTFHGPPDARPLILIGNGTGLASLRALLKERVANGQWRNWLLFGERQLDHDFHYRNELEAWLRDGQIERLDLAWSRDQRERVYVQQRLREAGDELIRWVDAGAAIYVCGSLDGLAPGVDRTLRDLLGDARVERLREQGRYRRDVY